MAAAGENRKWLDPAARIVLIEEDIAELEAELAAMRRGMRHVTAALVTLGAAIIIGLGVSIGLELLLHF